MIAQLGVSCDAWVSPEQCEANAAFMGSAHRMADLIALQDSVANVTVDESLVDYMLAIVDKTRTHEHLSLGVSPRGAQALFRATQAIAAVHGREFATPDDVKRAVVPVCAHRVLVNTRAALPDRSGSVRAQNTAESVLNEILTLVDVPL